MGPNLAFVSGFATFLGAWMLFDGLRPLTTGQYTVPKRGAYAGQLGPWAGVVRRVGIDPTSTAMKAAFVVYGIGWLVAAAALFLGASWAPTLAAVMAGASLWYLPVGTGLSVTILIILGMTLLLS